MEDGQVVIPLFGYDDGVMNVLVTGIQSVQDQILQRTVFVKLTARLGQLSKIITNSLNNPLIVAQENPVHIGGPSGDDEGPSCGDEHPSDVDPEKEYGGLIDKSEMKMEPKECVVHRFCNGE
ncbi:hypothetical protein LguiB_001932 [Lonicera macranthoides]